MTSMITNHPYIDNNGPTYTYGVCAHGQCGKSVSEHTTMIKADRPGGRRRTVRVSNDDPPNVPVTEW